MAMETIKHDSIEETVKEVNKIRLQNKHLWYTIEIEMESDTIYIKAYNTWVQQMYSQKRQAANYSGCMDISVKHFKEHIGKGIEYLLRG